MNRTPGEPINQNSNITISLPKNQVNKSSIDSNQITNIQLDTENPIQTPEDLLDTRRY
jgi:hypothetical protein